jgi:hypothetical protein
VDYEHSYIVEAHRRARAPRLHFITCDATAIPAVVAENSEYLVTF